MSYVKRNLDSGNHFIHLFLVLLETLHVEVRLTNIGAKFFVCFIVFMKDFFVVVTKVVLK